MSTVYDDVADEARAAWLAERPDAPTTNAAETCACGRDECRCGR